METGVADGDLGPMLPRDRSNVGEPDQRETVRMPSKPRLTRRLCDWLAKASLTRSFGRWSSKWMSFGFLEDLCLKVFFRISCGASDTPLLDRPLFEHPKKQTSLLMIIKAPNWECTRHNINTALFATTTSTTRSKSKSRPENKNTSIHDKSKPKKNKQTTMARWEACFCLFYILLFAFHWPQ